MSYYTQLEDALYTVCAKVFDGTLATNKIMFDNSNAPEPDGNYLLIGIRDVRSLSQFSQATTVDEATNTLRHRKVYQVLVDINAYGDDAYNNASFLENQFETEGLRNTLWDLGISVKRVGAMQRIPSLRETQYVPRGLIQVSFYFGYEFDETITETIDEVDFDVYRSFLPNDDLNVFSMTITTTEDEQVFTLPVTGGMNVLWGDGEGEYVNSTTTHTYAVAGTYQIDITYKLNTINFDGVESASLVTDIVAWGGKPFTTCEYMFSNCENMTVSATDYLNTSKAVSMAYMFNGCNTLPKLDLSTINTDNVTTMTGLFYGCDNLDELIVSETDTITAAPLVAQKYVASGVYYSTKFES